MDDLTYQLLAYPVMGGEPRVIPARESFISADGGNGLRLQLARGTAGRPRGRRWAVTSPCRP